MLLTVAGQPQLSTAAQIDLTRHFLQLNNVVCQRAEAEAVIEPNTAMTNFALLKMIGPKRPFPPS